ncbi:reverse transcriptase N-terminal domain-containing protein [Nostoc flagelliforme FACHB-838]|uniref:Reverse transcriptase N-terminal domain-containing protein n=1 Tax=Nostoc flagelliforme FACHB-838 TaxID=2692904 RepID=A0ABR8DZ23_9NOSO|nr:reverse transcriptase domain-containing protein [Nostoc flagelliforme]MBD2534595.1 reverse transcriptase N-terminal domain-containing protein [Nostoc flagelliforme FACHB-838]
MIRHSVKTSESWKSLPWKKFRANLFRLQRRVFKAVRVGDKRKAKSLQKLILKSFAARFMAIRQVTQLNAGKKTAGVDGKTALTHEERFNLELLLRKQNWYHNKLREIPIPKKDGSIRYLKVPTIADRCWQCLAKYALEPAHEAIFHEHSYGFRTGRSTHDAQKQVFTNLRSTSNGSTKRILELDIEKCFDRINHSTIMGNLIAPRALKTGIFRALKAGINPQFPEQGTPQGGVVSPLLANIALNGIENMHQYHKDNMRISSRTPKANITNACVRYADDMVFFLRPQDDASELLHKINQFLAERGMKVSEKKTKVTASTDGFNFLGWHFYVQQNGKFRCIPSEENFKSFRKKVKYIVNNSNYGAKVKASKLAPIVRGWRQYHKFCKLDGSRFSLWHIQHRTFKVFNKETKQDKLSSKKLLDKAFPSVPYSENAFIKVQGNKSPFDGDLVYWSKRNSELYDGATSRQLIKQNHSCGHCGLKLTSEERVQLHHIDGNHENWKPNNLVAVHETCHDYIHIGKKERK